MVGVEGTRVGSVGVRVSWDGWGYDGIGDVMDWMRWFCVIAWLPLKYRTLIRHAILVMNWLQRAN